jgi:hypothetical protein
MLSHPRALGLLQEAWLGLQDMEQIVKMLQKKRVGFAIFLLVASVALFSVNLVIGQEVTVCCEQTNSGLFCQDVPQTECKLGSRQAPTACESTSFCRAGYCFDSTEGTCLDNTPQQVCVNEGGIWSETEPAQCQLGCCVLGDQAAFVTQTRCKALSGSFGLATNYNPSITDEVQCVLSVQNQEKGACVFEQEFQRTCKFTTREDCSSINSRQNSSRTTGEFFTGKLCTAEELGTNCAITENTICAPGKDGVYFVDSCGNPANIYDSSKINDKEYFANARDISESCNPNDDNALNPNCGNCNYLLGSFCRDSSSAGQDPRYGDYICADLNCKATTNGPKKHGESWCVNADETLLDESANSVGSRFFRHLCINGEEIVEQCADFRQEVCIEDKIETSLGDFSQAACRVNRWQDCTAQLNEADCQNTDRRDCAWIESTEFQDQANKDETGEINPFIIRENGACVPKNTPGNQFWQGEETLSACALANAQCIVTFEKGLFGGEQCAGNCHCLESSWEEERAALCAAIGDCGPKVNWIGQTGYKKGFEIKIKGLSSKKD